jgi:hypothetical protein
MNHQADPHIVWVYFHKTTATVMDGHRQYYASCPLCQGAPSPKDIKDYDNLARISGEAKRSEADKFGPFGMKDRLSLAEPEIAVQGSGRERQ